MCFLDISNHEVHVETGVHGHLLVSDGGELVVAQGVRALDLVPEVELGVLLSEHVVSELVLLWCSVAESVLAYMSLELLLESKLIPLSLEEVLESQNRSSLCKLHHFC